MQRRTVIKQLALISGGVLVLPSCFHGDNKSSIAYNKIKIDGSQEKLLAELSGTLIPADDTPGAKETGAYLFALTMIDDCYKKEDQDKFIAGLKAFEDKSKKQYSRSFINCTPTEREKLLTDLELNKTGDADLDYFYKNFKKLTIQGYTTSKFFLTKIRSYKLMPGHFYGCVPVKNAS